MSASRERHSTRVRPRLTSRANTIVRDARQLLTPRARRERGEFLAEGVKLISDALALGASPNRVFVVPEQLERSTAGARLLSQLAGVDVVEVAAPQMERLTDAQTPQGVVAVFPRPDLQPVLEPAGHIVLILDGIQDPGNLGTIVRSAVGSGVVTDVLVRGGADPYGPKAVRAAAAALFRVRVSTVTNLPPIDRPFRLADARAEVSYDRVDWLQPSALAIGSEAAGASAETRARADELVKVPLRGPIESLNAAVATSIILFEAARQVDNARR